MSDAIPASGGASGGTGDANKSAFARGWPIFTVLFAVFFLTSFITEYFILTFIMAVRCFCAPVVDYFFHLEPSSRSSAVSPPSTSWVPQVAGAPRSAGLLGIFRDNSNASFQC